MMTNYFPAWEEYDRIIEYARGSRGNLGIKERLRFALNDVPQPKEFLHDLATRIETKYDFVNELKIEELLRISSVETTSFKDDLPELGQDSGVAWLYSYYVSYWEKYWHLIENGKERDINTDITATATNDNAKSSNKVFECKGLQTFKTCLELSQLKRLHKWLLTERFIASIDFTDFYYLFSRQPIKDSTIRLNWIKKYNGREFKMPLVWLLKTITEQKEATNLLFRKIEFLVTFNGSTMSYKSTGKKYSKINTKNSSVEFSKLKEFVQTIM
jgi:hypothetical protein